VTALVVGRKSSPSVESLLIRRRKMSPYLDWLGREIGAVWDGEERDEDSGNDSDDSDDGGEQAATEIESSVDEGDINPVRTVLRGEESPGLQKTYDIIEDFCAYPTGVVLEKALQLEEPKGTAQVYDGSDNGPSSTFSNLTALQLYEVLRSKVKRACSAGSSLRRARGKVLTWILLL